MNSKRIEEMESWRLARELTREIYLISTQEPLAKDVVLRDQLRLVTISIMSNITKGFEAQAKEEFLDFLSVAKNATGELKAQLYVALDQCYISLEVFKYIAAIVKEVHSLISCLMNYIRAPQTTLPLKTAAPFPLLAEPVNL